MDRRSVLILGGKREDTGFVNLISSVYEELGIEEVIYFPGVVDDFYRALINKWVSSGIKIAADEDAGTYLASYGIKVDFDFDSAVERASVFVCFDRTGYDLLRANLSGVSSGKKLIILSPVFSGEQHAIYAEGIFKVPFESERTFCLKIPEGVDYSIAYFVKLLEKNFSVQEAIDRVKFLVVRDREEGCDFPRNSSREEFLKKISSNGCGIHISEMKMPAVMDFVYFDIVFKGPVDVQKFVDLFDLDGAVAMTNKKDMVEIREVEELLRENGSLLYIILMSVSSIEMVSDRELVGYFFVTPHFCEAFNIISAITRYFFPRSSEERMRKVYSRMVKEI